MDSKVENIISAVSTSQLNKNSITSILSLILRDENISGILTHLDHFTDSKDAEIQQLCDSQDKVLISSLGKVQTLTDNSKRARENLLFLQSGIANAESMALASYDKLEDPLIKFKNLGEALTYIDNLYEACELCTKAKSQISNFHYVSSLRTLGQLKELEVLREETQATQLLLSSIPMLEDLILDECRRKFNDWLVSTKELAESIGDYLFTQADARLNFETQMRTQERANARESTVLCIKTVAPVGNKLRISRSLHSYMLSKLTSLRQSVKQQQRTGNHSQDIDFSELVNFENIYTAMGRQSTFTENLKAERKVLITKTFWSYENFRQKLRTVIGQIVIEKELSEFGERFRTEEELQNLWVHMAKDINHEIVEALKRALSAAEALEIKHSVVLAVSTLKKLGFTYKLYEFYTSLKDGYPTVFEKLKTEFRGEIVGILAQESFAHMANGEVSEAELRSVGLESEGEVEYYSFSRTVLKIALVTRKFIDFILEYLEVTIESIGETLFKAIEILLKITNEAIFEHISIMTTMQTAFTENNVKFLFKAYTHLCNYYESAIICKREFTPRECFIQLKDYCENAILEKLKQKLDLYLKMIPASLVYNGKCSGPEDWAHDFMVYLENSISSLRELLGAQLSSAAFLSSLDYLNQYLLKLLCNCHKFNIFFMESLFENLEFINSCAVCREMPGTLQSLKEIKQIVGLFVGGDLESLKAESKYAKENLELLMEIFKRFQGVTGKRPSQKDVKTVAKKLKKLSKSSN